MFVHCVLHKAKYYGMGDNYFRIKFFFSCIDTEMSYRTSYLQLVSDLYTDITKLYILILGLSSVTKYKKNF